MKRNYSAMHGANSKKSLYRSHSFQDRILKVNAPDRVQAELMGHKFHRPMYGDGASLEQKKEWMDKICVKVTGNDLMKNALPG